MSQFDSIEKAYSGQTMKKSIIDALKSFNDVKGNADSIDHLTSEAFISDDDLKSTLDTISKKVDDINGKVVNGGIFTKLNETQRARNLITDAITTKGQQANSSTPLDELPDKIRDIITKPKTGSLSVTENGTYDPKDDGYDGYSRVSVKVDIDSGFVDLEVTENGTYTPEGEGARGFKSVKVDVPISEGPFDVMFYDSDGVTVLQYIEDIPYGGEAIYTGPIPIKEGLNFAGWNPDPSFVTYNMVCYPEFSELGGYNDKNEITDSWDVIIKNKGAKYPIGSWKALSLKSNNNIMYPNRDYSRYMSVPQVDVKMTKVYAGESNSVSTWISTDIDRVYMNYTDINGSASSIYAWSNISFYTAEDISDPDEKDISSDDYIGWAFSTYRSWLNTNFLNNIVPENLRKAIKSVKKYSAKYDYDDMFTYCNGEVSHDKIWAPSRQELYHYGDTPITERIISETKGIDNYLDIESMIKSLKCPIRSRTNYYNGGTHYSDDHYLVFGFCL